MIGKREQDMQPSCNNSTYVVCQGLRQKCLSSMLIKSVTYVLLRIEVWTSFILGLQTKNGAHKPDHEQSILLVHTHTHTHTKTPETIELQIFSLSLSAGQ